MPSFPHSLIGLGPFADLGYIIIFTKTGVSVVHPDGHSILEGWRETDGPKLWYFPLDAKNTTVRQPAQSNPGTQPINTPMSKPIKRVIPGEIFKAQPTTPSAPSNTGPHPSDLPASKPIERVIPGEILKPHLSSPTQGFEAMDEYGKACFVEYQYGVDQALAVNNSRTVNNSRIHDLPSVAALVGFYHACLGFPVKQSWLEAIKAGNLDSLEGLTYSNVARYCPD